MVSAVFKKNNNKSYVPCKTRNKGLNALLYLSDRDVMKGDILTVLIITKAAHLPPISI